MTVSHKNLSNQQSETRTRLSLQYKNIGQDTFTIRSQDWDRSRFDIEFGLRNGTTYNSFLIRGEKTALIDTSHIKFHDIWFQKLEEVINPQEIDFLIVSHTEPDHSGLIGSLISKNPKIKIIASKVAIKFLESQVHCQFQSQAIRSGEKIDLGINPTSRVNHQIEFISAPNLHWPDTIFSYDHGTGILYTCDAFGLHFCSETLFDQEKKELDDDFRFYYDCLMGPNARSVIQAIKRIEQLPKVETIAVGHGPLLRIHLDAWINDYKQWSNSNNKGENYVAVCYISQHGFCDQLSQAISQGVGKTETQAQLIDLQGTDPQELTALISDAKAVIVPTWPSQLDDEVQQSLGTLIAALSKKQWIGVYESFGENDEPIDVVSNQLLHLGQKEAFKALRVKDIPNNNTYQEFIEAGIDIGQVLKRKKNIATMKEMDGNLVKAMGKLSGGLYIVTACQSENSQFRSAMVASWISQASFEPPGITVAVAKDRAIESLMQVGDRFIINVLQEDNYLHLFRHFLKRFPPGADRFEGVSIIDNLSKAGPILTDALAFLGCLVKQRLETPDHWIIYAVVEEGKVANTNAKTAVHHRKVGSTY